MKKVIGNISDDVFHILEQRGRRRAYGVGQEVFWERLPAHFSTARAESSRGSSIAELRQLYSYCHTLGERAKMDEAAERRTTSANPASVPLLIAFMDILLADLPAILVFAVILPWIAAPVVIYFTNEMPELPEFFPLTDAEIESCTTPTFLDRSRSIEALGFEQAANLQWITPTTRCFMRLFYRPATHELSHVSEITATPLGKHMPSGSVYYMEFVTEFQNGAEFDTNNSRQPGVFTPEPQKQVRSLPGVNDAATLYKVHRYLTSEVPERVKPLPSKDRIAQSIEIESARTLKRQVEAGYFYLDELRGTYRPTAVGAALMSWKLVWPVGMIRRALMRRNAAKLVRASAHLPG